jgi:ATP-dependent Clp protease adapter protein ClpS
MIIIKKSHCYALTTKKANRPIETGPGMADKEVIKPVVTVNTSNMEQLEDMYEVVLWNDEHNEAFFVVNCLMQVFSHDSKMALKIMLEAHRNGKAIAEVEGSEQANLHREQLLSFGLTATVEKI